MNICLETYTNNLLHEHNIPSITIAVWEDGTLHEAAAGLLNLNTGVEATSDSIFQIGSITKVMTTCLVMQLVDEGRVDLDRPVKHYLRDFQIADPQASESITVRQLLNHTNGMAGDYFPRDIGQPGNLIARYVDRCSQLPLVHPVGKHFSYSNSAFAAAGRLVEVLRGLSWYQAMKEFIFQPLGLRHAIADPMDMIRYRTAMGHIRDANKQWVLPDEVYFTLGLAPVGETPATSAADLIRFACAHMDGGPTVAGKPWLSTEAIQAMQTPQIEWPYLSPVKRSHMGLGWMLHDISSGDKHNGDSSAKPTRLIGHSGATNGFLAQLQLAPEQNTAFAILLNSFDPQVMNSITAHLQREVMGITAQEPEPSVTRDIEAHRPLLGHYESMDAAIDVAIHDQQLTATITAKIDPVPPERVTLHPLGHGCFATYSEEGKRGKPLAFVEFDQQGVPQYLFNALRLNARSMDRDSRIAIARSPQQ